MADPADIARTNEPTAEELALARSIAGAHGMDHDADIVAAVAHAIRETTSLGCAWLESMATKRSDRMKVEALRTNAHLKDIGHGIR